MTTDTLAEHLREYGAGSRGAALWDALMVCRDCPHRMIEHDLVALRCRACRCNQSHRGLSAHADDRLMELGAALSEAYPVQDGPRGQADVVGELISRPGNRANLDPQPMSFASETIAGPVDRLGPARIEAREWPEVACTYAGLHDHRVAGGFRGPWEGPHSAEQARS